MLEAHFVSIQVTADNVLDALSFPSSTDRKLIHSRRLLVAWIKAASADMLVNFIRCISGQIGITRITKLNVHYSSIRINISG